MKNLMLLSILLIVIIACQTPKEGSTNTEASDTVVQSSAPASLKLKWETDSSLTTCESVLFDKDNDILYVSNINGAPDGKDGNGFISKLNTDGKITELQWVKGIDAPKGMGLSNGKLFVTDIDRIHEIDVKTGKITKTHKVDGAKFLNDITVDGTGKVYASDSGTGAIVVIENGKLSTFMEGLNGPNGLLAEDSVLLVGLWAGNSLQSVNVSSKQMTMKTDSVEAADGLEAVGDGTYLVSSWNGMVHYIDGDSKKYTLLDVRADSLNTADIEYVQEKNLLLVPTFFGNTVRAYEFTK